MRAAYAIAPSAAVPISADVSAAAAAVSDVSLSVMLLIALKNGPLYRGAGGGTFHSYEDARDGQGACC